MKAFHLIAVSVLAFLVVALPAFSQADSSSLITLRGTETANERKWQWSVSLDGAGHAGSKDAERIYKQLKLTPTCQTQTLSDGVSERCTKYISLSTGEGISVVQLTKTQSSDDYVLYALLAGGTLDVKTPKVPFAVTVKKPADNALLIAALGPTQALSALNDRFSLRCDKEQSCSYIIRSLNYYTVGKNLLTDNPQGKRYEEQFTRGNFVTSPIQKGGLLIISGDQADELATAMGLPYNPRVPYQSKVFKLEGGESFNCVRSKSSGNFCILNFQGALDANGQPFLFPEKTFSFNYKKDINAADFTKQFYFKSKQGMLNIQCSETAAEQTCAILVNPLKESSLF